MDRQTYEATYRRSETALPGLLGILAVLAASVAAIVYLPVDGNTVMAFLPFVGGGLVVATVIVALAAFRVHRWTIEADGVRIEERPKFLLGLRRSTKLAFADIAALRRVESGFDPQMEIAAQDGKRFRLSAKMTRPGFRPGLNLPDPESLEQFAAALRAGASAAGHALPAPSGALSFWNKPPGLFLLVVMFAISLLIAGLTAFVLSEGMAVRPRSGETAAILLLLPLGAGYLLLRSFRRRWTVLAAQRASR